jgi:hypothetical protein
LPKVKLYLYDEKEGKNIKIIGQPGHTDTHMRNYTVMIEKGNIQK